MDYQTPPEQHSPEATSKPDVAMQQDTLQALKDNTWTAPVHLVGYGRHDGNAVAMLRALATNTSATSLCIQKAHMYMEKQNALVDALTENSSLRTVNLTTLTQQGESNNTQERYTVPAQLFASTSVRTISLKQVHLDDKACQALASTLRDDTKELTKLILVDVDFDPAGQRTILDALCHTRTLTSLTIKNLSWKAKDMHRLAKVLGSNQSIQTLAMEGMKVHDESSLVTTNTHTEFSQCIANLLSRNSTLQSLSIRSNQINALDFAVICRQGLAHNASLQKFFVSDNPLGWEGVQHLLEVLSNQDTDSSLLQQVCLAFTSLGIEGCTKVARVLPQCKHLRHLTLDGNGIEQCGQAFLECLERAYTIVHLFDRLPKILQKQQQNYAAWCQVDILLRANDANRRYLPLSYNFPVSSDALLPHVLHRAANAAVAVGPKEAKTSQNDPNVLYAVLQGLSHNFPKLCNF